MDYRWITAATLIGALGGATTAAQALQGQAPENKPVEATAPQDAKSDSPALPLAKDTPRSEAYYNFTMGHFYEQQYEATSRAEYATQAIEAYKKAYALDPKSPVIGERLAEMYWKAQRTHEAIAEAQEILKRDPNDVPTRRLLGRIYLRSLGAGGGGQAEFTEPNGGSGQTEFLTRAIEQYREIHRLEPTDSESALWLARLYRLHNDHDKAAEVLRSILKDDPDPSELSHKRGLAQTLLAEEKYSDALAVYQKLADLMPDDPDVYLRMAQIYREQHELDKAEENLVKARQYSPGSLEVMYNEAMLYQAQGRYEDAIRVLSDAVTGIKGQSNVLPSRHRSLAILYQQLGQL